MMERYDGDVLRWMRERPVELGRQCGFGDLREVPHGLWLREMLDGPGDITLLAHRGSYKTTCLSLAVAVILCTEPGKTLLFLRKTDRDVEEILRQVQGLLLGDAFQEATARLYGAPVQCLMANSRNLTCDCRFSPRGAAQLHGQGIGASLTGQHADLIFTDDIVNGKDRVSEAERSRTRRVWMELQNIRNPGGRIFSCGTPWHPEDALSLMPNHRRWDCHATGLLTEAQLDELRQAMAPSLFAANYELRHIPEAGVLFPRYPDFTEDPALLRDGMAHLDASYGGEDFIALTCGRREGDRMILYGRLWPCHVDTVLGEVQAECDRLTCAPLHLEVNGDKGYLARELRRMGVAVHPYTERMNKHMKIATILRKWWPHVTLLRGTDPAWINQVTGYTLGAPHDDAPDSAASLVRALERGGG